MNEKKSLRTKAYMKKFVMIYVLAAIACVLVALVLSLTLLKMPRGTVTLPDATPDPTKTAVSTSTKAPSTGTAPATKTNPTGNDNSSISVIDYSSSQLGDGILAIINSGCPTEIAEQNTLTLIKGEADSVIGVNFYFTYLTEPAFTALNNMQKDLAAATASTMKLTVSDGYTVTEGGSLSSTSEYSTGNSFEVKYMDAEGRSYKLTDGKVMAEYSWMKENAWRYGLVFRYPEDKAAITGVTKANQLRYVGTLVAEYMHTNNCCLEELHNIVKEYNVNNPLIIEDANGKKARLYFAALQSDGNAKIYYRVKSDLETYRELTVSGNGSDGFTVMQEYFDKTST